MLSRRIVSHVRKSEEKSVCVCVSLSLCIPVGRLSVGFFDSVIFLSKLDLQESEVEKSVIHRMWLCHNDEQMTISS